MPVLVQKYGGTSVGDPERIRRAAARALAAQRAGNQVVLVVSAMGQSTDELITLAKSVSKTPSRREMDMLLATGEQVSISLVAMAIEALGGQAVSMTGWQAGIHTDADHGYARITTIETGRIRTALDDDKIVVVAGFQGLSPFSEITTLGRGGSDTTAVALAAALRAPVCEIYTDVAGIYSTDPRLTPNARLLKTISYDEMLEMASLGAGVMHGRSVELGKRYNVEIHVRSSFTDEPGTRIMAITQDMEGMAVSGATLKRDIARVTLPDLPNKPGVIADIFNEVAQRGVFVDDIILGGATQPTAAGGMPRATLSFTVAGADAVEVTAIAEHVAKRFELKSFDVDTGLARVSVVGVGMRSHRGVAATMFAALSTAGINIENITTSEIVISALVRAADAERALQTVHTAFGLDRPLPQP
jgi:aspartate kinase